MSEQHGKVDEAAEIFDEVFPSSAESVEIVASMQKDAPLPAFPMAVQLAAIRSSAFASAPVQRDQFDFIVVGELRVDQSES